MIKKCNLKLPETLYVDFEHEEFEAPKAIGTNIREDFKVPKTVCMNIREAGTNTNRNKNKRIVSNFILMSLRGGKKTNPKGSNMGWYMCG